jgi:hypothetical protein
MAFVVMPWDGVHVWLPMNGDVCASDRIFTTSHASITVNVVLSIVLTASLDSRSWLMWPLLTRSSSSAVLRSSTLGLCLCCKTLSACVLRRDITSSSKDSCLHLWLPSCFLPLQNGAGRLRCVVEEPFSDRQL